MDLDDDDVGRRVMPRNARLLAFSDASLESMSDDPRRPIVIVGADAATTLVVATLTAPSNSESP